MKIYNIFRKKTQVNGLSISGRQLSIIKDNIDKISYLINYDLLAYYHVFPIELQHKIDKFFNVHRPHEVMNLFMEWIEEYYTKTNENPFELDHKYKVVRISSPEFQKHLLSNISKEC